MYNQYVMNMVKLGGCKTMSTKIRQSNFEFMRLVSMFLIVVWHVISHTKLLFRTTGALNLFLNFIYIVIAIHVNSFVLVSGYFQYDKQFKMKKFFSLISITWFYKCIYALIFVISGIVVMSEIDLFLFIQPINFSYSFGEFYWFINMYIFLYLLSPFINKMIKVLSQKEHKAMIIILFIMLSIIPYLCIHTTLPNTGYTISHFTMLYIIGAYLGKYKLKDSYHFKNYSKNKYQLIILTLFLVSIICSFIGKPLSEYFNNYNNSFFRYISGILGSNLINFSSPFIVIESILYLLLFETFDIKNKLINKLSSLTLGIYLVHENKFVYKYIYQYLPLGISGNVYSSNVIIYLLIYSIVIFIISALIEVFRILIFKIINKTKLVKKAKNSFTNYIKNF